MWVGVADSDQVWRWAARSSKSDGVEQTENAAAVRRAGSRGTWGRIRASGRSGVERTNSRSFCVGFS